MKLISTLIMISSIFYGLTVTGSSEIFLNVVIMPIVGGIGYYLFRIKALFVIPIMLYLSHFLINALGWNPESLDTVSILLWTSIYCAISLIGFIIAALIHIIRDSALGKTLTIISSIVVFALICGVCLIANALNGNPVSKLLAHNASTDYLHQIYPDMDYYIEDIGFNFKDTNYYAHVRSESSIDTQFTLYITMSGDVYFDTYEDVLSGSVTARRLSTEYRKLTDHIFKNPSFPYVLNIGYGIIEIYPFEAIQNPNATDIPDYAIVQENLIRDQRYDIRQLGAQAGKVVIYIESETVSYIHAAEIMTEIQKIFDEANIPFHAINFVLQYPLPEEGQRPDDEIRVENFLYTDILQDDLPNKIKAADSTCKAYYAELDRKQ